MSKKNTYNQDLKFINKIEFKINIKVKFEQILGSTMTHLIIYSLI